MGKYLWMVMILLYNFSSAQIKDTRGLDFYREFGNASLEFFKGSRIGDEIYQALVSKNARVLGGYAAVLFYAERCSGRQIPQVTGLQLLEVATQFAMIQNDTETLRYLAQIWEEPYFGPGNREKALEIRRSIEKLGVSVREIMIIPDSKAIPPGSIVLFQVVYKATGEEIPIAEVAFSARYGRFWENMYQAPDSPCTDSIEVQHLPSGQVAQAKIIVEVKPVRSGGSLPESPWKPSSSKRRMDAYQTLGVNMAQKILMKEEEARVQAMNNMGREIERILAFMAEEQSEFREVQKHFSISQGVILTGIKTENPYVYEDTRETLRVTATMSAKAIVESLRADCRNHGISFTKTMRKKLLEVMPETIEVEGTASLK